MEALLGDFRAVGEARTRDPQLGKLMLYQLSYYRKHPKTARRYVFYGEWKNKFFVAEKFKQTKAKNAILLPEHIAKALVLM